MKQTLHRRLFFVMVMVLFFAVFGASCRKNNATRGRSQAFAMVEKSVQEGRFDEAMKHAAAAAEKVPPPEDLDEILFLQGWLSAFHFSDLQRAASVWQHLLDVYPDSSKALLTRRFLADVWYWQARYDQALDAYRTLAKDVEDVPSRCYARLQAAHCLVLKNEIGEALTAYRKVVDDCPAESFAETAQLMIGNLYVKIGNPAQARLEFEKLAKLTKRPELRQTSHRQMRKLLLEVQQQRRGVEVPRPAGTDEEKTW